jgi:surface antigen-like variable number repeat protein
MVFSGCNADDFSLVVASGRDADEPIMSAMRCRLAPHVLAIAYFLSCQPPVRAQVLPPAANPDAQNVKDCVPSSAERHPSGPEVTIVELNFEGDLRMPIPDQDQIATSLKQRTYWGDPDGVASEVLESVRRAWQNRGFFKVRVRGGAKLLTSSPASERISIGVQVDEGQQFLLGSITFKNNRGISSVDALRNLFRLKDGDIFSREKIAKGLDTLRFAYRQLGYINSTSVPETRINEESRTISLDVDIEEGKQFYISSINVIGHDADVLHDLLLKPGDIYDQRLVDLFLQRYADFLPTDASTHLRLDERKATVAIAFDFRRCPLE